MNTNISVVVQRGEQISFPSGLATEFDIPILWGNSSTARLEYTETVLKNHVVVSFLGEMMKGFIGLATSPEGDEWIVYKHTYSSLCVTQNLDEGLIQGLYIALPQVAFSYAWANPPLNFYQIVTNNYVQMLLESRPRIRLEKCVRMMLKLSKRQNVSTDRFILRWDDFTDDQTEEEIRGWVR